MFGPIRGPVPGRGRATPATTKTSTSSHLNVRCIAFKASQVPVAESAVEERRSKSRIPEIRVDGESARARSGALGYTRLEKELDKARLIIDVQGKVAGLLGLSLEDGTNS